ncbi:DUF2231 domain-containing protein [Melissospora conviva]|uniref:DUF2231 domain-containing protein n=1 Tax=Melissospora conviva TaxID=3388432 RepID=UPI003B7F29D2
MESRLRIQGHPIQPMLVMLPYGLFACATIFDLAAVTTGLGLLGEVGYWTTIAALFAAALAVVAGMVDLWDVPTGPTRRTAIGFHLAYLAMAGLFVLTCLIRAGSPDRGATGGILAAELLALAVGGYGVALGARLGRSFDHARREFAARDAFDGPAQPLRRPV